MSKGFMRISRDKLDDFGWSHNPQVYYVFFRLLFKASYKDKKIGTIDIKRGQIITGRKLLSAEFHLSEQQIRTCLTKLESTGYINQQSTNKYTIITICEYDSWQGEQPTNIDISNQQITNNQPTNNQQITTIKIKEESKEVNKEKKEEDTNVSKKKDSELSDLESEFERFRIKYRRCGGKVRGLQTELGDLKKKHKDWKEVIPLLNNAIENENKARKDAEAMNKFFPSIQKLQTYLNNRSWEAYISDDVESNDNEYRPLEFGVQQKWNPVRKCLEVPTPYHSMLNDGYTNDNRPDGAMISWQMYMWKWSADKKVWIEQK